MSVILIIAIIVIWVVILTIYKGWLSKKIENDYVKIGVDVLLSVFLIPLCFYIITQIRSADEKNEIRNFHSLVLNTLVKEHTKSEDLHRLLLTRYKEFFASSEDEAKKWVDELLSNVIDQKSEQELLKKKGESLAISLTARWQPIYNYVLTHFDQRINQLSSKKQTADFERHELSIVFVDNFHGINEQVRRVKFNNGHSIFLKLNPGKVEVGKLISRPSLRFMQYIEGQYFDTLFTIDFSERSFALSATHAKTQDVIRTINIREDPMLHREFRESVVGAINYIISSTYLKDPTDR